jgi:nitrogen fixation protein FixH
VTDADYYSKGLKYTSTLLEKKAATTLGWKVSTQQVGRSLLFQLSDKEGQPVRSAKGLLFMYRQEVASSIQFPLQEVNPGVYQFNLTGSMTGEISARVEFEYKGARLSRQLLLNL